MVNEEPFGKLLKNQIFVNHSSTRSINIEYDIKNEKMLENYLFTPQVRLSINRIFSELKNSGSKSWTLTGPYGSGKSFFSLFIANLLTSPTRQQSKAISLLKQNDPILAELLSEVLGETSGFFLVPINGYRASLDECIYNGISSSIQSSGNEELINWFNLNHLSKNNFSETGVIKNQRIITIIDELTTFLTSNDQKYKGLLFLFDEMGKTLEQAGVINKENDIYLLQEIAEHSNRKSNLFIGILHQSFERYATLLDSSTQHEWAKIQGRFEDIPFQEPPVQQLRLLQRALTRKHLGGFEEKILQIAVQNSIDGWKPSLMEAEEFSKLAQRVYPIHPSTFSVLPYFFRRLAQNERSLFAFLTSMEPFGFQDFLSRNNIPSYFRLPDLFDYLLANYQGRIYTSGKARILSETSDRLETIINLSHLDIKIIKTVGLLNWMSEITNINATKQLIMSALLAPFVTEEHINNSIEKLIKQSVLVFRRFNQTYFIWQGSDVDLDERISVGFNTLKGNISIAKSLEKYLPPRPLVARKHSYTTGTLRFFEIRYIDIQNYLHAVLEPNNGASGICFICLPTNLSEINEFINWAKNPPISSKNNIVVGITNKAIRMSELILELSVLNWVKEETSELRDDPVARKELRARISNIENLISLEIEDSLNIQKISSFNISHFFYCGKEINNSSNSLAEFLSEILDKNYAASPVIQNEIINRNKLSTQAAMARKAIIHSILTDSDQEHFGYVGYPPQRSVYENLLAKSGMHLQVNGKWIIQKPIDNHINLLPTWNYMEERIFGTSLESISVETLFNELNKEPYGLTFGVAPILLCVFLKVFPGETALYKQNMLIPEPSAAHWDLIVSRPDLFSVSGFHIEGARKNLVERFARGFNVKAALMPIVKTLVKGVNSLPEHTLVTKRLNPTTLAVREAIIQASSPEKLLFEDIPFSLGLEPIDKNTNNQAIELFFDRLNQTNSELVSEMNRLLFWARDEFLKACGMDNGETGWGNFRIIASQLMGKTNQTVMKTLYTRATDTSDSYAALEKVLAYIANRPPRNWTDMDSDRYLARLNDLGEMFNRDRQQYAFDSFLTPKQQEESEHLANFLLNHIQRTNHFDPIVIKAAINKLRRKLEKNMDDLSK